jgi:hypothetical protein
MSFLSGGTRSGGNISEERASKDGKTTKAGKPGKTTWKRSSSSSGSEEDKHKKPVCKR